MMRLAPLILFALTLPAGASPLCPLVAELNRVVAKETTYPPAPCPVIGFSVLSPGQKGMRSQAGAFDPATGRIELAPDLDLSTALGQSYLLHELVHAAQVGAGQDRKVACIGQLEAEAYRVQASFLMAKGLPQEAQPIVVLGAQLGSCGQSDY